MPEPLYTPTNCTPAYELRWSLALFATTDVGPAHCWLPQLKAVVEDDGVRILEQCSRPPHVLLFLVSTKPHVAPPHIVKSVKGRLQHLLHSSHPKVFRRNFSLSSVGEVRREVVEAYVARQLGHHPRLSRAGILADHLHLTLGCRLDESPEDVALGYLNNLAYAHGMRPLFRYSYYVGTFGEYDMAAVRRRL